MRGFSIENFPPHVQNKIREKIKKEDSLKKGLKVPINLSTKKPKQTPKYRNRKTTSNGIKFDSKKEAKRYEELFLLLKKGEISDLRLQVDFTLQEAYTTFTGERIHAIRYKADFTYLKNGQKIVEDVKSRATKTRDYMLKKKLLADKHGLEITEI